MVQRYKKIQLRIWYYFSLGDYMYHITGVFTIFHIFAFLVVGPFPTYHCYHRYL